MPFAARDAVFKKLSQIADISALSPEDKEKYDESMKVMLDYYETMEGAKIIGKQEGRAEGRTEGRAEGIQQGKLEIAGIMLEDGDSIEKIMRTTGLSRYAIEALKNNCFSANPPSSLTFYG